MKNKAVREMPLFSDRSFISVLTPGFYGLGTGFEVGVCTCKKW